MRGNNYSCANLLLDDPTTVHTCIHGPIGRFPIFEDTTALGAVFDFRGNLLPNEAHRPHGSRRGLNLEAFTFGLFLHLNHIRLGGHRGKSHWRFVSFACGASSPYTLRGKGHHARRRFSYHYKRIGVGA